MRKVSVRVPAVLKASVSFKFEIIDELRVEDRSSGPNTAPLRDIILGCILAFEKCDQVSRELSSFQAGILSQEGDVWGGFCKYIEPKLKRVSGGSNAAFYLIVESLCVQILNGQIRSLHETFKRLVSEDYVTSIDLDDSDVRLRNCPLKKAISTVLALNALYRSIIEKFQQLGDLREVDRSSDHYEKLIAEKIYSIAKQISFMFLLDRLESVRSALDAIPNLGHPYAGAL